jgi:hypothetical protein
MATAASLLSTSGAALLRAHVPAFSASCVALFYTCCSLKDNEEHVVPLDIKAPSGASTDDRVVSVRFTHEQSIQTFLKFAAIRSRRPILWLCFFTLLQIRVPLGVDLRTAPLHGTGGVDADTEFGQPRLNGNLPGSHLKFKGLSDIFSDSKVDSKHKHYP